jgi:hypothetical protein
MAEKKDLMLLFQIITITWEKFTWKEENKKKLFISN